MIPSSFPHFLASNPWSSWWLPTNYSAHGGRVDSLFTWIFWITMTTFILVEATLVVFLIKYRSRPGVKKAKFTHGNTRLEMCWTIAPAIILLALALASKQVWDEYRYADYGNLPDVSRTLVIGQQFKWNIVYPGPDKKLGKYLIFPRPTDAKWPVDKDGKPFIFKNVPGPASLPYEQAVHAINDYIEQVNPLGKVFDDPAGKDDDWVPQPGREMCVPVNRPLEVQLSSKDVIHDFFLPNFRVKLDAVPGMRGIINFKALKTSRQREDESRQVYTNLDDLAAELAKPGSPELVVSIDENSPGVDVDKRAKGPTQFRYVDAKKTTIVRNTQTISAEKIVKLKEAGIKQLTVYKPGYWDLVCEELCGQGHYTMQGRFVVLDQDEYARRFETAAPAKVATAQ